MAFFTLNPTSNSSPDSGQGAISDLATRKTTSNTNPDPGQGGSTAVTGATNTGHGSTTASSSTGALSYKSCLWSGVVAAGVTPSLVVLKVDWNVDGSLSGLSTNGLFIDYSTDGGSNWNTAFLNQADVTGPASGTAQATLANNQDLTLVRVRDAIQAQGDGVGGSASITASVSSIRVEVTHSVSGAAVSSPSNTGHGSTTVSSSNDVLAYKTCLWSSFPASPITPELVKLKVDWTQNGSLSGAGATNSYRIEYSLNGGSSWSTLRDVSNVTSSSSGTSEITLSNGQDITQVRVRNRLLADAPEGSSASLTVTTSGVRVEVSNNPPQMLLSSMM